MPYAPGVVDRSGEILAGGITSAANTISDTIDKYSQITRQTKAYRTMAVDGLGMDPDEVDKMSLPQLQGHMQGVAVKNAQAEQQAKIADLMSQRNERDSIGNWRQSQADASTRSNNNMSGFNQRMSDFMQPGAGPSAMDAMTMNRLAGGAPGMGPVDAATANPSVGGRLSPELVQQMMAQSNLSPAQMQDVAKAYQTMGGKATADNQPKPFSVNGIDGLYNPKSGNFVPSPTNKTPGVIELHDEDNNPTGVKGIYDAKKGKFVQIKAPDSGELKPVIDPNSKQPLLGFGRDAAGKIHDFRTVMQKTMGTPVSPGASPDTAAPAAAAPAATVRVKNAAGKIGTIPASQLKSALKKGFTQVE